MNARIPTEYLTIKQLRTYSGFSERTLRSFLTDPVHPLPHFRVGRKAIRVKRADFDQWIEHHRADHGAEVDRVVEEVLGG